MRANDDLYDDPDGGNPRLRRGDGGGQARRRDGPYGGSRSSRRGDGGGRPEPGDDPFDDLGGERPEREQDGGDQPEGKRSSGRVILNWLAGALGVAAAIFAILGVTVLDLLDGCDDPPPPVATITAHRDGNLVGDRVTTVGGTSSGISGSSEHEIWVVVVPQGTGRFYPQGAALSASGGTWAVSNVHVGQPAPQDAGLRFMIHAVVADEPASAVLHNFFQQNALNAPGLVQLPPGATVTDTVTVTRQ